MKGTITAIIAQKRNPHRVNIYLDGNFAFGLSRIVSAWLHVGQELDQEKINRLLQEDAREACYQAALNTLKLRPKTEGEMQRFFKKHSFPEEVVVETMERLKQSGLINDRAFALNWIENRCEFRPRSRMALVAELRQKGISDEIIEETLAQIDLDEEQLARQLAEKKAPRLVRLDWPTFRKRLGSYLTRHGFNYDIVSAVTKDIWNQQQNSFKCEDILEDEEFDHE